MSQRPEDIQRRLSGLDQIGQVTGALRAIASGQSAAARGAMAAINAHAQTVAGALAAAAALAGPRQAPQGAGLVLVIGAAQGFSGAYPARIAEAAQAVLTPRDALAPGTGVVVIGNRTLAGFEEAGTPVLWSADLAGHPDAVPELASQVADALVALLADHPGPIRAVIGPVQPGQPPEVRTLFPPEVAPLAPLPPLTTLPPAALMDGLLHEALFAALAQALMQGLAAEAQARMEAMARAQNNLKSRRAEVQAEWQQARQEQMTTEMIELASARPPD